QLASQRFDLGSSIQTQHPAQILWGMFLEAFGTFDPSQRHQEQRQDAGAQPVKGRSQTAINLLSAFEHTSSDESRQGQQNSSPRHTGPGTKERSRIVQEAEIG